MFSNGLAYHPRRFAALVGLLICLPVGATTGIPGSLDENFGPGNGRVISPFGVSTFAYSVAVRPDGKILLAGQCFNGSFQSFCLARYTSNGTLDTAFGSGSGKVITPIGSGNDRATSLALQPDGKIVLAGVCTVGASPNFCLARYSADGALDLSFNGTGKVTTAVAAGGVSSGTSLTLQPDGKIVVGGYCTGGFCMARYESGGALDATLNGTGKVITALTGDDIAWSVGLQADGKILLAGRCLVNASHDFCLARYNANGTLDTSLNGIGKVITPIGPGNDSANSIAVQPDGKIILGGSCFNGSNDDFCLVRYNANGALDVSLNGTGKLMTAMGSAYDTANSVMLQADGKIVLAGNCQNGVGGRDFCFARYSDHGVLDTSINGTGKVIVPVGGGDDFGSSAVLQTDGKILIGGTCAGINGDFCLARFDGGPFGFQNCKPDIDGDGQFLATTDALIFVRIAAGFNSGAVINGITFPANATRKTWPSIRDYLMTQCGMSLVP